MHPPLGSGSEDKVALIQLPLGCLAQERIDCAKRDDDIRALSGDRDIREAAGPLEHQFVLTIAEVADGIPPRSIGEDEKVASAAAMEDVAACAAIQRVMSAAAT